VLEPKEDDAQPLTEEEIAGEALTGVAAGAVVVIVAAPDWQCAVVV
jgi:hypothetical protein